MAMGSSLYPNERRDPRGDVAATTLLSELSDAAVKG